MAWIEGTVKKPLGNQTAAQMSRHDIICLHTMVGYLKSTDAMFREGGYSGVESHFGVGGAWGSDRDAGLDGVVWQWQDTTYRADANLEGNHRLISIETADNAPRSAADIKPWTDKQCQAIIKLVAKLCKRYDIPPVLVPDSKASRRGIAYHRQGINPWRVSGGELWSGARGKECPGDARIRQISTVIIPGVKELLNPTEDIIMDKQTKAEIREIFRDELRNKDNLTVIARELFDADVIEAPDSEKEKDPTNKTWKLRSILNRLVSNTNPKVDPPK